jgi:pimeloyl-ACP methyl ester carboxylesterase
MIACAPVAAGFRPEKDFSVQRSETRYAKTADGVHIAYRVAGGGPPDLVYVPGWISNVDMMWEEARLANFLRRLASFARLIVFDKRGTGLSDRLPESELLISDPDGRRPRRDGPGTVGASRTPR